MVLMEKTLGFLGNQFVLVNFFYHKTKLGWTVQIQTVILVDYPTLLLVLTQMWHLQCWLFFVLKGWNPNFLAISSAPSFHPVYFIQLRLQTSFDPNEYHPVSNMAGKTIIY